MKITAIEPGMKCFFFETPIVIEEVTLRNPAKGIEKSEVVFRDGDGNVMRCDNSRNIKSKEEHDKILTKKAALLAEGDRLLDELKKLIPSLGVWQMFDPDKIVVNMHEKDCLRIIKLYGGQFPASHKLPSAYSDPSDWENRLLKSYALARNLRQAVGMGQTSRYHFPLAVNAPPSFGLPDPATYIPVEIPIAIEWNFSQLRIIIDGLTELTSKDSALAILFGTDKGK